MTYPEEMQRNFMCELRKDIEQQITNGKEVNPKYIAKEVWKSGEVEGAYNMMINALVEEIKHDVECELKEDSFQHFSFQSVKEYFEADFVITKSTYLPQVDDYVDEKETVFEAEWDEAMALLEHNLIDIDDIIEAIFERYESLPEKSHMRIYLDGLALVNAVKEGRSTEYCADGSRWWSDSDRTFVEGVLRKKVKQAFAEHEARKLRIWKRKTKEVL